LHCLDVYNIGKEEDSVVRNHSTCNNMYIKGRVAAVLKDATEVTGPDHREHMRIQRKKLFSESS